MVVELKETDPVLIDRFVEILREADRPDRTLLATFYPETMAAFRERLPEYPTSAVQPEIQPFVIMDKIGLGELHRPPAPAFQVPEYAVGLHVVTPSLTRTARRLNLHIEVWSAGSWDGPIVAKPDMERLLNAGVDGIITDRPDLLLELLGRR
jgi:glycerophosphoryl diester phosphodiesterase